MAKMNFKDLRPKMDGRFYYGWVMLFMGFICMFIAYVIKANCSSLFYTPICEEFGITRTVYAQTNTTMTVCMLIGSAYIGMNSKALGADIVYMLPDARIGLMDEGPAAKILAKEGDDLAEVRAAFAAKQSAEAAASRGIADRLITMETLRRDVLQALEMLFNKRADLPEKKHGTK